MQTSYGNTGGGSCWIFWTAEYQNNFCSMYNTVYEYIFFTDVPLCSVQISRLYFRVYLFYTVFICLPPLSNQAYTREMLSCMHKKAIDW